MTKIATGRSGPVWKPFNSASKSGTAFPVPSSSTLARPMCCALVYWPDSFHFLIGSLTLRHTTRDTRPAQFLLATVTEAQTHTACQQCQVVQVC